MMKRWQQTINLQKSCSLLAVCITIVNPHILYGSLKHQVYHNHVHMAF